MIARMAAVLAICVACHPVRQPAAEPHIESVRPDSVMLAPGAVVEVVVRGRGFAPGTPGRNTIQFGDATITGVPASADGSEIHLVIPDRVPVRGDAAPLPLEAGRYSRRVKTSAGTSNDVSVRVDR
jgi:hypothetical protein